MAKGAKFQSNNPLSEYLQEHDLGWQQTPVQCTQNIHFPPGVGYSEKKDDRLEREQRALKICAGCPVNVQCLEYAIEADEQYGIWGGGVDVKARKELLKELTEHDQALSEMPDEIYQAYISDYLGKLIINAIPENYKG